MKRQKEKILQSQVNVSGVPVVIPTYYALPNLPYNGTTSFRGSYAARYASSVQKGLIFAILVNIRVIPEFT